MSRHRASAPRNLFRDFTRGTGLDRVIPASPFDAPVSSILLKGGWVVTQNPQRDVIRGDVLVQDGRIATVGAGEGGAGGGAGGSSHRIRTAPSSVEPPSYKTVGSQPWGK